MLPVNKAAHSCTVSHTKLLNAATDLADDAADLMTRNPVGTVIVNHAHQWKFDQSILHGEGCWPKHIVELALSL